MMTEYEHGFASIRERLDQVEANVLEHIDTVDSRVLLIGGRIEELSSVQQTTRESVERMYSEFQEFVAADRRGKELQRSLTEIVRVRQELDKRFGHYDAVRKAAVGILQASSLDLVRKNTMHELAEELMSNTARYWLPPALLSLSAWISDDQPLAERGMREALRRDEVKTSLFFTLICRRAGRSEPAIRWLSRYFATQDPGAIDREVVVMLDGLAYGVFGGEALNVCSETVESWLAELEARPGFTEEQRRRWKERLDVMSPQPRESEFPTLKYSPMADQLFGSLAAVRRNQRVLEHFTSLFRGELVVPGSIEEAVDSLLDSLVSNFDEDELPLRREERLLQLVKQEQGDRAVAEKRFAAETEAHDESMSFAALLTSAAMNPEQVGATQATQRYAVSRCRRWIQAAHTALVLRDRAAVPERVELVVGSWHGSSVDGSDRDELLADLSRHYEQRVLAAVEAVKLGAGPWVVLAASALVGLPMLLSGGGAMILALVVLAAAVAFFAWKRQELERRRASAKQAMEQEKEQARAFLAACFAELGEYRRAWVAADGKAQAVADFLGALSEPKFVLDGPEPRESAA